MPMAGLRWGVSWSWKDDSSSANQSGGEAERATSQSGRPMLPAVSARMPPVASRCAVSEVVVVLPLVPVIPMHRVPRSARKLTEG